MELRYVNAYRVARFYGGPEEGGWWYDGGEPLASIPIEAERVKGHGDHCGQCSKAKDGNAEYCKNIPQEDLSDLEEELSSEQISESQYIHFTNEYPDVYHLAETNPIQRDQAIEWLKMAFESEDDARARTKLSILIEDNFAQAFPDKRPRYE